MTSFSPKEASESMTSFPTKEASESMTSSGTVRRSRKSILKFLVRFSEPDQATITSFSPMKASESSSTGKCLLLTLIMLVTLSPARASWGRGPAQASGSPKLCEMGCGRSRNPKGKTKRGRNPYSTCCRKCGISGGKKHNKECDKRNGVSTHTQSSSTTQEPWGNGGRYTAYQSPPARPSRSQPNYACNHVYYDDVISNGIEQAFKQYIKTERTTWSKKFSIDINGNEYLRFCYDQQTGHYYCYQVNDKTKQFRPVTRYTDPAGYDDWYMYSVSPNGPQDQGPPDINSDW